MRLIDRKKFVEEIKKQLWFKDELSSLKKVREALDKSETLKNDSVSLEYVKEYLLTPENQYEYCKYFESYIEEIFDEIKKEIEK